MTVMLVFYNKYSLKAELYLFLLPCILRKLPVAGSVGVKNYFYRMENTNAEL